MRRALGAVLVRPSLWPTALRVTVAMARRNWWRRPPFLPLPTAEYLRLRLLTQYGDERATLTPDDLVRYLTWRRAWDAARR